MEQESQKQPLVSVVCLTFNHANFIRETLEGFVNQKTQFSFEVIVHDDCSTDSTAEIILDYASRYPEIIKPLIRTENQYRKYGEFSAILKHCYDECYGRYIALCEGDDYWTDALKLQKQVDYLESHPGFGMCYTRARCYEQDASRFGSDWGGANETFTDFLKSGNTVPTLTTLFRKDLIEGYYEEVVPGEKKWPMADYPMWLYFSKVSEVKFLPEVTGVYRALTESASHSNNNEKWLGLSKADRDIRLFFAAKYNEGEGLKRTIRYRHFRMLLNRYIHGNPDLRRNCLEALGEIENINGFRKRMFQMLIKYKLGYHFLRSVFYLNKIRKGK